MSKKGSQRSCAAVGCSNSGRKLSLWREELCAEHGMRHEECPCPEPFILYAFPKKKDAHYLQAWIRCVNRTHDTGKLKGKTWMPNRDSRICSEHFVSRSLDHYYPILKMGHDNIPDAYKLPVRKAPVKRKRVNMDDVDDENDRQDSSQTAEVDECIEKCQKCEEKDIEISKLKEKIRFLRENESSSSKVEPKSQQKLDVNESLFSSKGKMMLYCGMTKAMFDSLYDTIKPEAHKLRHWKGPKRTVNPTRKEGLKRGRKRKLTPKNEFFLSLMKLKTGLHMAILGDLFDISQSQVSRICFTWFTFLSTAIGSLVYNPEKGAVMKTLPTAFQTPLYRDVRHIVDGTEIFIETPKNLLLAASCWSDYKHHHTVKYLVSINPNGHINYISKGWGGRTSDNYLTEHCGFLDILEPYDKVMADRGFQIQKLLAQQFVTLVICFGYVWEYALVMFEHVRSMTVVDTPHHLSTQSNHHYHRITMML